MKKDIKKSIIQQYCKSNFVNWCASLLSLVSRDNFEIIFIRYFLFIEITCDNSKSFEIIQNIFTDLAIKRKAVYQMKSQTKYSVKPWGKNKKNLL